MLNKDRPFKTLYEAFEAYCAEVLCLGEDSDFWEQYQGCGADVEKYLSRDYGDGIYPFLDWLWGKSTEGRDRGADTKDEKSSNNTKDDFHIDAILLTF